MDVPGFRIGESAWDFAQKGWCCVTSVTAVANDALLSARRADLSAQIARIQDAVSRLGDIDDVLHARVADRLAELIDQCRTALKRAENADDPWERLRGAYRDIGSVSSETLAFTQGALLRKSGVDAGFCALADKLLDHFNDAEKKLNWRGFTILADTAYFREIGDVVRLRFPEVSIWDLPVAAHEFGHYANPLIRVPTRNRSFTKSEYPVNEYLKDRETDEERPWFHAHELMADIFAVYALGAAYAYCVLFLRPDPGTIRADTRTHPSWSERFYLILETLGRIALHNGVTSQIVDDVKGRWERIVAASPGNRQPDVGRLTELMDFFYPLLDANLHGVRYTTFGRALQLAPALGHGDPLPAATIPDILNAAWLARLDNLGDQHATARISRIAASACEAAS
jgi:hypothetical protein